MDSIAAISFRSHHHEPQQTDQIAHCENAQHSLGRSLQRTRRRLGFDLETVTEQTHISAHDIDLLEIGKSRRFNHAIKLALFYDCEIEIGLTRPGCYGKKRVRQRRQASPPLYRAGAGGF